MSKRLFVRFLQIGVTAACLGVVACNLDFREPEAGAERASVKNTSARQKAPEFALKDAGGKLVHLSDFKGKVVLLDFWETWCEPCNIEMPWFMEFERKYKDRGFEVLGIALDDDGWKIVSPFVAAKKLNYRVVLGDDKVGDLYGSIEALPTTFVIDRDGRIASTHVGLSGKKVFADEIEKLLLDVPGTGGGAKRANAS